MYDKTHIAAAVTAAQAVLLNPGRVAQQPGGAAAFVPLFPESDQPPFAAEAADNTSSTGSSAAPLPYVTASPSTPPKGNKKGEPSQKAVGPNAGSGVRHSKAYGSLPPAREYEMPFTTDRVVLEISGADADLTIVDLPGAWLSTRELAPWLSINVETCLHLVDGATGGWSSCRVRQDMKQGCTNRAAMWSLREEAPRPFTHA